MSILTFGKKGIETQEIKNRTAVLSAKHYFPLDSTCVDTIGGLQPLTNTESGQNLMEVSTYNWRDLSNFDIGGSGGTIEWDEKYNAWKCTGYVTMYLKIPRAIPIVRSRQYFLEIEVLRKNDEGKYFYWGGKRLDSNKALINGVGGTYDYSCASAVKPPVGQWTTYKRYYKTGESESASGWGAVAEYYAVGGLINYSGTNTQVTYIRNIKFGYVDADNSNAVYSDDALELDNGHTNLADGSWDYIRTHTEKKVYQIPHKGSDVPPISSETVYVFDKTMNAATWSGNAYGYSYFDIPVTENNTYTYSAWVYVSEDSNITRVPISVEQAAGGAVDYDLNKKGTWQKLELTFIAGAGATNARILFYPQLHGVTDFSTLTGFVAVSHVSLIQERYAPAYVPFNSSTSATNITIDKLNYNTFSINFDFCPAFEYYKYWSSSYNVDILTMVDNTNAVRVSYTDYYGAPDPSKTYSAPFLDPEPNASWRYDANWHMHHNVGYKKGKWYNITIGKENDKFYVRWIEKGTNTVVKDVYFSAPTAEAITMTQNFTLEELNIGAGYGSVWRGKIKNLAIFDRLISLDESKILAKDFQTAPTFNKIEVIERPIYPYGGLYFPLTGDLNSADETCLPVSSGGVEIDSLGAFVGHATTNQVTNQGAFSIYGDASATIEALNDGWYKVKVSRVGNYALVGKSQLISAADGETKTWSVEVISPSGKFYPYLTGSHGIGSFSKYEDNHWVITYTNTKGTTITVGAYWKYTDGSNIDVDDEFYFRNYQVEAHSYRSAFTLSSRAKSLLTYNIKNMLGVDWDNGPWTIIYWKKPVATHLGSQSGYNLSSIGSNSTTGYFWFGKSNSSNTFRLSVKSVSSNASTTFDPAKYFDNWHMEVLRNDGVNITYRVIGPVGDYTMTVAKPSSALSYERDGRDLQIGGWDQTNVCNTYYRDLFITPNYLDNSEIESIYKVVARMYKDKGLMQIRNVREVL